LDVNCECPGILFESIVLGPVWATIPDAELVTQSMQTCSHGFHVLNGHHTQTWIVLQQHVKISKACYKGFYRQVLHAGSKRLAGTL
jgi:hypothetical protein